VVRLSQRPRARLYLALDLEALRSVVERDLPALRAALNRLTKAGQNIG